MLISYDITGDMWNFVLFACTGILRLWAPSCLQGFLEVKIVVHDMLNLISPPLPLFSHTDDWQREVVKCLLQVDLSLPPCLLNLQLSSSQ